MRYAVPTMIGEMRRWLRDHTWAVRPPREAAETWLELLSATERLSATLGHAPTTSDLAEHLDLSIERVIAAMEARRGRWALSLDAPAHADAEDRTVGDQLGMEDEGLRRAFDRAWLDELSAMLEPLERDVMQPVLRRRHVPARDRPAHGHVADEGLPRAAPRGRAPARRRPAAARLVRRRRVVVALAPPPRWRASQSLSCWPTSPIDEPACWKASETRLA